MPSWLIGLFELIIWAVFVIFLFEKFSLRVMDWLVDGIIERDNDE